MGKGGAAQGGAGRRGCGLGGQRSGEFIVDGASLARHEAFGEADTGKPCATIGKSRRGEALAHAGTAISGAR